MDIINEIKLAIYESSLENGDKEDLLNIVESTDDEEILCDVVDVLTESYKDKTEKDKLTKEDIDEIKEDLASYKVDLREIKSLIRKKKYAIANIKIKHAKDRLNRIEKILKDVPIDVDDKTKTSIIMGLKFGASYLAGMSIINSSFGIKNDKEEIFNNASRGALLGGIHAIANMSRDWKKQIQGEIRRQHRLLDRLSSNMN